MMLRASNTDKETDLTIVVEGKDKARGDVPNERELLDFVEAVYAKDRPAIDAARNVIRDTLGGAAMIDAVAVAAHFSAITKVADGTGIRLDKGLAQMSEDIREDLGLNAFDTTV